MKRYTVSTKRGTAHDFLEYWSNFLKKLGANLYYVIAEEKFRYGYYELLLMNYDEAMLYSYTNSVYKWTGHGCEQFKRR